MSAIIFRLIMDILFVFCGFGLGYKKGFKDNHIGKEKP